MNLKKIIAVALVTQVIFVSSGSLVLAKADDLVIEDNGQIVLVINNNGVSVLGASATPSATTASAPATNPSTPAPKPAPATPSPQKVVPIVPAHTESTVQINPSGNNDKKIQVTIIKGTPAPVIKTPTATAQASTAPLKVTAGQTTTPSSVTPNPSATPITFINQPSNVTTITKTVDQVVEQGTNGQPVVSIKSDAANSVTVQQGPTQVSTSLPIQIDSTSHVISVVTPDGNSTKVSVLPTEAVQGATENGLITSSAGTKTVITETSGQIVYNVSGNKTGKLLGIFPVKTPVSVQVSAETGKVVKVTQAPLLTLFGFLVR